MNHCFSRKMYQVCVLQCLTRSQEAMNDVTER